MTESSAVPRSRRTVKERLIGGPEGFRKLLQRRGPIFIKIGQFLALRPDLIPEEYCEELLSLLDDAEPFSWSEAKAILEQDLGDTLENFRSINPRPAAAGSMAQVHLGILHDGAEVAVKILRPGIAQRIHADLRRARALARLVRMTGIEFSFSPTELLKEVEDWLVKEIDLAHELENMDRMRTLTKNSRIELIPKSYPHLSSSRILTAEYLKGIPLSEVLRATNKGGEDEIERLNWGIHLDELAQNIVEATLRQMFRYQFFHADVHPGNLIASEDDCIGYVDFGLCEEIDETVRKEQIRYLSTVYEGDVPRMFRALLEVLTPGEGADEEGFRIAFVAQSSRWLGKMRAGTKAENQRSPIAQWLIAVMRAARQHHFIVPMRLLAMYRTLLTAETVAQRLSPTVNLRSVGRDFFVSLEVDDSLRSLRPEAVRKSLPRLLALVRDSPGQIQQLLSELAEDRFTLRVETTEDGRTRRAKDRRARLVATAILSVGLAVLAGSPAVARLGPVPMRPVYMMGLLLLYIVLFRQWRQMR